MSLVYYGTCDCGADGPHTVIHDGPRRAICYCESCGRSFTWDKGVS